MLNFPFSNDKKSWKITVTVDLANNYSIIQSVYPDNFSTTISNNGVLIKFIFIFHIFSTCLGYYLITFGTRMKLDFREKTTSI